MFQNILEGFHLMLTLGNLFAVIVGVSFGVFMGAVPGLTATMGIALIIPMTYFLEPITAFAILLGAYKGGLFGGSIPAILINTPGTPAAAATVFDGYPMAQQGKAGKAMGIALYSSVIADAITTMALILIAVQLAKVALKFGPPEYATLIIFSMTIVASVSGKSLIKGLLAATVGFLFAIVGLDPMLSTPRFVFGSIYLFDGISIMAVVIGLFAVSEVLFQAEQKEKKFTTYIPVSKGGATWEDLKSCLPTIARGSLIGLAIGAIPGIGGTVSSFLSYSEARRVSKHPEQFGKGAIQGVAAAESGNNAVAGGTLIPLMALGIPGNSTTAVLLGAFMIHGLTPGPTLFKENSVIVYGIFAGLLLSNIVLLVIGGLSIKLFSPITKLPKSVVFPITAILTTIGVYGFSNSYFDLWVMLLFGVIGYLMRKYDFPLAPLIIGFVLEPIGERAIRQSLILSGGSPLIFVTRPISVFFLFLAVVSIFILSSAIKKAKALN